MWLAKTSGITAKFEMVQCKIYSFRVVLKSTMISLLVFNPWDYAISYAFREGLDRLC